MLNFNSVGGFWFCFSFKIGKRQSVSSFQVCSPDSEAHEAVSSSRDDKCTRGGKAQTLILKSLLFITISIQPDLKAIKNLYSVTVFLCMF